jgi:hypothetical protein
MESDCISIIPHLMKKHGTEAMVLTLRVLTETNPHNRHQLNREVITAVNAVCRSKRWTALGLSFLEAWDAIDLGELRQRAISFGLWMQPVWVTMVALIIDRLRPVLEPLVPKPTPKPVKIPREPKPPISVTRIPAVQANVNLGLKLLTLRATTPGNCAFWKAGAQTV